MTTNLSAWALKLFNQEYTAPIWSSLATPDNSATINIAAAAVIVLSLLFFTRRLKLGKISPWLFALSILTVPQFLRELTFFSPVPTTLALSALSLLLLSPSRWRPYYQNDDDDEYPREPFYRRLLAVLQFTFSGIFAALATWEGTYGIFLAPLIMIIGCLPIVRQHRSVFFVTGFWALGYGVTYTYNLFSFSHLHPALGLFGASATAPGVFLLLGITPFIIITRFGEVREHLYAWAIAMFMITAANVFCLTYMDADNPAERFVKAMLSHLNGRRIIVSDGIFDNFIRLLKPADVKLIGMRSNSDRELLLSITDNGDIITNLALVVHTYYNLPEMAAAADEIGLIRRGDVVGEKRQLETRDQAVQRLTSEAKPLFRALDIIEKELSPTDNKGYDLDSLRKEAEIVRSIMRSGHFRGSRISKNLLMIDIILKDNSALEADALDILIYDRNDPAANAALGALRQESNNLDLAEKYLRRAVEGGGAMPMAKLAILLIQTKRYDEAIIWARKAVELQPTALALHEPLIAALIESGKIDEAKAEIATMNAALEHCKGDDASRAFVADALRRLEEKH